MYQQVINRVRLLLLTECFGASALGLLIFVVFLFDDLVEALAGDVVKASAVIMGGLIFTGTVQILFNERWLRPIARFLSQVEAGRKDQSPGPGRDVSRIPFLLFRALFVIVLLIAVFFVIFFQYPLGTALKLAGVCWAGSALICGILYLFLAWSESKSAASLRAEEALQASLSFPLKSAGLSALLWVTFAVYISVGARVFLGFRTSMCIYLLLGASSSGVMAFCIQYFLFKLTLSRLIFPLLSANVPPGVEVGMFLSL